MTSMVALHGHTAVYEHVSFVIISLFRNNEFVLEI